MKSGKFKKKLTLNKTTIANLENKQMESIQGGGSQTCLTIEPSCATAVPDCNPNTCGDLGNSLPGDTNCGSMNPTYDRDCDRPSFNAWCQ